MATGLQAMTLARNVMNALSPGSLLARKALVIAPHPDDESLGCGGLMASLAQAGCLFHTIFVTDGGASHPHSRAWPRDRLSAQREQEAAAALACLGLADHPRTFLRLRDAQMPTRSSCRWRAAITTLRAIIRELEPDLALIPWRRDPHRDHRDSWLLIMDALAQEPVAPVRLEYAVWLDELGAPEDRPIDDEARPLAFEVAAALPRKRTAISAHLSQIGNLITDDPAGFRLTPQTIERLTRSDEIYWRPLQ
jgi:LmbE family N-acetylglucosaminyl deacetylase